MSDADDTPSAEATHRALVIVAVRAVMLREVMRREWDGHEETARARAWESLMRALDDLELAEPGIHARMHETVAGILAEWQEAFGRE